MLRNTNAKVGRGAHFKEIYIKRLRDLKNNHTSNI